MVARAPARPVTDEEMTDAQAALTAPLRVNGVLPNGFRVGLRAWKLFQAHLPFSAYVMSQSSVPPRLRELAIIRIAHSTGCDYELRHHAQGAMNYLGVTQADVDRICEGPDAEGIPALDALVIRLVDDLREHNNISDDLYARLIDELGEETLTELLFTIGNYESMARVINVLGVPMDDDFDVMHAKPASLRSVASPE